MKKVGERPAGDTHIHIHIHIHRCLIVCIVGKNRKTCTAQFRFDTSHIYGTKAVDPPNTATNTNFGQILDQFGIILDIF